MPQTYTTQGVTIWLTGLSGSGKSTIADILEKRFREWGLKTELLDGDVIRTNLSKDLDFTKEGRDMNIRRVGFVCELLTRNNVIVLASVVSPYRSVRDENRQRIGRFVEVYVKASLEECEERDVKGLYKKARAGEIKGFTGIDDPYEEPIKPEVVCQTANESPEESAQKIIDRLESLGYLSKNF